MRRVYNEAIRLFMLEHSKGNNSHVLTELVNKKFNTNFTVNQITSYRYEIGALSGIDSHLQLVESGKGYRYPKGHIPTNKGTKGMMKPNKTSFKPGQKPHNTVPIGTEILRCDGYVYRKIAETKPARFGWKQVHHLVWEEHHGKVPEGHRVVFLDQNRQNFNIDNLRLVSIGHMATINHMRLLADNPLINNIQISVTAINSIIHNYYKSKLHPDQSKESRK